MAPEEAAFWILVLRYEMYGHLGIVDWRDLYPQLIEIVGTVGLLLNPEEVDGLAVALLFKPPHPRDNIGSRLGERVRKRIGHPVAFHERMRHLQLHEAANSEHSVYGKVTVCPCDVCVYSRDHTHLQKKV